MESIEIIITDDKEQYRKVCKEILESYPVVIIGEAENGEQLIDLLKTKSPHVVLLDLEMPVMDGNKAFSLIREKFPKIRVIILSNHYDLPIIEDYIERGAKGYIAKDHILGKENVLINAIRQVKKGKTFVYELPNYRKLAFSERQKEIVPLLLVDNTNEEIAKQLGVTTRAIEKQKKKIYEIIGVKNALEFYKNAFSKGWQYIENGKKKK